DLSGYRPEVLDSWSARGRDVAADAAKADAALDAVDSDPAGHGIEVDRRSRRHHDGVIDRHVVVPIAKRRRILGSHLNSSLTFVHDNSYAGEISAIAASAFDGVDGHLVARGGRH